MAFSYLGKAAAVGPHLPPSPQELRKRRQPRRWSLFFKNVNPRKPAPGPEHGMLGKGAKIFGNGLFWGQLKSAFHGGSRRLRSWHGIPYEEIEHEGCTYRALPGYAFGVTSIAIVHRFTPPTRYKAKHLDSLKLICNATGFIQAIERGIQQGLI